MSEQEVVYIGLGSNLDDPQQHLRQAIEQLGELPHSSLLAVSSLYASAPLGPQDQPDYSNAVVGIHTGLEAMALLDALQLLEQQHGRVRRQHWGPRTLDLDILLFGAQIIDTERLQVPHPHMHNRRFVLQPLLEIAPGIEIPGKGEARTWLARCNDLQVRRIGTAC